MNDENKYSYYLIKQIFNNKSYYNKIYEPTDDETIKAISNCLLGTIAVFKYDENNKFEDLTKKLGRIKYKKLEKSCMKCQSVQYKTKNESKIFLSNTVVNSEKDYPKVILSGGNFFYRKYIRMCTIINADELNVNKSNIRHIIQSGKEYEIFIGNKYEEQGFNVIYNGIEQGVKDGGLDLICTKDNRITFVQCKNWVSNAYYQINQKDIRAFLGDCYKYIIENNIISIVNYHFIYSHQDILSKSAISYLKNQNIIKYKVIKFLA